MDKQQSYPQHVAIIPDGNRRWAKSLGLSPQDGHKEGFKRTEDIMRTCIDLGIHTISFWGASLDNLVKRPLPEMLALYSMFKQNIDQLSRSAEIHDNQVKINVLGRWKERFPGPLKSSLKKAMELTKDYNKFNLNFFLAYNGDDEIIQAIKNITTQVQNDPSLEITPKLIKNNLFTKDLPPVDLLIRTGGEPHNSVGFMMWDTANSQYYFTDLYYPEFVTTEFTKSLEEYAARERRLGK